MSKKSFPSPFDLEPPEGASGWEKMYSWYHLFGEERRPIDEERFWFHDRLHHPGVLYPYDEIFSECWWHALGAFNTRIFAMPPAFGVDQRVLNGYLYASPVPVPDPEMIPERAEVFKKRAGYYYENWDQIYVEWKLKTERRFTELKAIRFEPLPELEEDAVVFDHVGTSSGYRMIETFDRMILIMYETFQWHFELLNIGYAAYLTFFDFCKRAFPEITDQAISRMVGGLDIDLYRPDDELKRLAKKAEALGIGDVLIEAREPEALFSALRNHDPGKLWVEDWEAIRDPWFRIATDPGHPGGSHRYRTWLEDEAIPLDYVKDYILRLRNGEKLERPTAQVRSERDRITAEYRAHLSESDQPGFDSLVDLARRVMGYIEEHMLYIDHWMWSTFWEKSRELAQVMSSMGYFDDPEDFFYLRRYEVMEALYDLVTGWAVGTRSRGPGYWRPIIKQRREILAKLEAWDPPPALGEPPEHVSEPFTVMLWGITTETIREWLADSDTSSATLKGVPGAPGIAEGPARIIRDLSELDQVQDGDVLICPATSPSWSPVFSRVVATVSDVGGIMSHTAIICREYGLPAVVGTGNAVSTIRMNQRVRVDGGKGTVTILG